MKNFVFDGRLGRDAEILTTKSGKQYVHLVVANDVYVNGEEKVDWIDVTCYDPHFIENRAKYFTKGRYVIVSGDVRFDVAVKENKVWKNIYVTAGSIEMPNIGSKDDQGTDASQGVKLTVVETLTQTQAAAQPQKSDDQVNVTTGVMPSAKAAPAPMPSVASAGSDSDLPF